MVAYLRVRLAVVDEAPGPGEGAFRELVEQYAQQIMLPAVRQHLPGIIEIVKGMDGDTVARMIEADCVDEESLEAM